MFRPLQRVWRPSPFLHPLTAIRTTRPTPVLSTLRTLVTVSPKRHATPQALLFAGFGLAGALSLGVAYCEANERPGYRIEPDSKHSFPETITVDGETRHLVGLGVRKVSFLKVNVYVVGLYISEKDLSRLRGSTSWKGFRTEDFLESNRLAEQLLNEPIDLTIRVEPIRTTNGAHLRDGFTRSLLQRLHDQSTDMSEDEERDIILAIQEFKNLFPKTVVKPGSAFLFTRKSNGVLRLTFQDNTVGDIPSSWLSKQFFLGYLGKEKPNSEGARKDIAAGLETMLT
ncbi:hypothetical protein BZG36_01501 [Bifiguratus adelaidae]|uniref:Chalcone isomerase domain-containing protein n=1 Tax=Bifiguratus adelaidae TaxID=1938954 RepID=A0A261Y580_9FUNG|nr:hypothetical protein BZG36_01501 [Bifiguratus adelaidae]